MLRISPFTPLFFNPSTDRFGAKSKYVQKFSGSDIIFIELIGGTSDTVPDLIVHDLVNEYHDSVEWHTWDMNENQIVYFHVITGLNCGYYNVQIGDSISEMFKVTNDAAELDETTIIQYSMKDNRQRTDSVFWIDGMQYFLDFRAPGGFKDSNWAFTVDNEQFTTPDGDIVELYSREATQKVFTLGNSIGCPIWFADFLNRILCCNYVYFDGVRYVRKDSSVPELNQEIEGLKSFIFNQQLQQIKTLDPALENRNQLHMRRVDNNIYRHILDGVEVYKPLII